ncbi:telomeric DNA binding protein [Coprinopsis cinerea okayama7|uniref:Telomeric DNA binding protein n=1 Tax=Coprinopsis cinerea (strain Okayama-7 / 130 / ATCC MYA-4618 / FGSC 9003) TaxID=240176 RepID=A8NGT9_COPC7|nr:telomeric DNA binding protein [Coprinopsis cinerea okayama7\|eukprot:XP_001833597.1 telomeric DNA binding protein [Coprinopsis cinerea okayama7\
MTSDEIQDLLNRLQAPIDDVDALLGYLTAPLESIGLLPPLFKQFNVQPLPPSSFKVSKHLVRFQRLILQHVFPTWDSALKRKKAIVLAEQYFCPDLFCNALPVSGEVALIAHSTLLSSPLSLHAIGLLERLANEYPLDRLYDTIFIQNQQPSQEKELAWNDCVRNLVMVPSKVANAIGLDGTIPSPLENGTYFNRMGVRLEKLIARLSREKKGRQASIQALSYLLNKLVNVGLFPSSPPISRTQPSFFQATLATIRSKVHSEGEKAYFEYWNELLDSLPSSLSLQSILVSLFASLEGIHPPMGNSPVQRGKIREEAILLSKLLGIVRPAKQELWEISTSLILSRNWSLAHARIFVCWVSAAALGGPLDVETLDVFMQAVLGLWSSTEHVKHSLLSQHQYASTLLLLSASYFLPNSPPINALTFSSLFIDGITKYLSHQDTAIRHCGMLVAEETARMCNKKLDFGGWEGDDAGRPWARSLRELIRARDVDAELDVPEEALVEDVEVEELTTAAAAQSLADQEVHVDSDQVNFATPVGYDSDDSLTGYASDASSESSSPDLEELAEIEKDPTLNIGKKKVARPVYLKQLGDMLRGGVKQSSPDDPQEVDRLEMGLNCAEELIRKKASYGTELAENAVNLVYALLSLNDNYDLPGFSSKRQGAMNALVACAPRQAAPSLIEEFFKNQYSADQRYVALNALAMGARELASLPIPESTAPAARVEFPSKMLPPSMHRRYIAASQADRELVPLLMDTISRSAIEQQRQSDAANREPTIVREKALRIKKAAPISEATKRDRLGLAISPPKKTTFTQVAAEFFIAPLVNRFWLFLREEQTREQRTAHLEGRSKYRGAGTGLILNPLILSHFLRTLGILVNASQNAPEWLAIIAPDTLELAVSLGTRPISASETEDDEEEGTKEEKEASVISSALELSLVILDGCLIVDDGRTLGLEHTTLLLGVQEWAGKIFESLEQGLKISGGGGMQEARIRSTTAGVLLKVDEIISRWKRSMLDWR